MDLFGAPSLTALARLGARLAITYFLLLIVARFLGRRVPEPGNRDLIVAAMLGGLVAPALVRPEDTPFAALAGIILLFAIHVCVSRLAFQFPAIDRRLYGPSRVLVTHGQVDRRELIREGMTLSELISIVRSRGVDSLAAVDTLILERNGVISVTPRTTSDVVLADIAAALERLEKRLPPAV